MDWCIRSYWDGQVYLWGLPQEQAASMVLNQRAGDWYIAPTPGWLLKRKGRRRKHGSSTYNQAALDAGEEGV